MKKLFALFTGACLLLTTVVGCSSTTTETTTATETAVTTSAETFHVVTSNFATYDWTVTLLGDDDSVTISYLLDSGVDSHSYQPSADDIIEIAECDLFIYVGGESDTWVDGVLAQATNEDMIVLNLIEVLGDDARAEETVEGMEVTEHDHDHEEEATEEDHDHEEEATEEDHDHEEEATEEDHDHEEEATEEDHDHDHEEEATEEDHDHDHEEEATEEDHDHDHEEGETDEHIWLSLTNAQVLTSAIAEQLMVMNSAGADSYSANLDAYLTDLADLDTQYAAAVDATENNTIVVADRFPFLYLVSDYGIDYYAAFNGCSAETEASFETIVFLAGKVDELGLTTILTIENPQHQIAQTVSATATTAVSDILELDSMQSITAADIANGATYYSIMEQNLPVLIQALG